MKFSTWLRQSKPELWIILITLAITVSGIFWRLIDVNLGIGISAAAAIITTTSMLIKADFTRSIDALHGRANEIELRAQEIVRIFRKLDGRTEQLSLDFIEEVLEKCRKIKRGNIPLTENNYFSELLKTMKNAENGWDIRAVSSSSKFRWDDDPRQTDYFAANQEAMARGAKLHRIFIVGPDELKSADGLKMRQSILNQIKSNICVDIVFPTKITADLQDDFVLFYHPQGTRAVFRGEYQNYDRSLVLSGEEITDPRRIAIYARGFAELKRKCESKETLSELLREPTR